MPEFSHEQLLELYKIAIEEYRFQVRLNWDRTAYQLTLNSGLIAIAVGLMKIGSAPLLNLFVGGIFLVGLAAAVVGIQNVLRGHRYYRNTIVKKTLLEDQLGLTKPVEKYEAGLTMGVGTTTGQNEQIQILHNTERWLRTSTSGNHHLLDCLYLDIVSYSQRSGRGRVPLAVLASHCDLTVRGLTCPATFGRPLRGFLQSLRG